MSPKGRCIAYRRVACAFTLLLLSAWMAVGCRTSPPLPRETAPAPPRSSAAENAFLDTLEERTFRFFWELSHPRTGLTPDRAPTRSFSSVAAVGFGLTAYPIGIERGYVTRAQGRERTLQTLRFLWRARQDSAARGSTGYRGFFYHFLDPGTGARFEQVELSTIDTALLMAGVLFCQSYFNGPDAAEDSIRAYAESLYTRVEWDWAQPRPPTISLGWTPERGFLPYDWRGYNEAMLLQVLALGSPTHPVGGDVWSAWSAHYRWGVFHGFEHLGFAPLFGHQYSHVWIDFRGIRDSTMRAKGSDYFENSRRATLAQRAYAIANPNGWAGYGVDLWGLTACDGPVERAVQIDGRTRQFHTYWARGASFTEVRDDGTVSPSAAGGSLPFAPEVVLPALIAMRETYGEHVFSTYGFVDALNPTLKADIRVQHGRVDPTLGWFDTDYLGIDQGPILAMVENHRSGLVWRVTRRNRHVIRGLRAAGFTGGWLDSVASAR
ncbi:MAG TPA: glucoamylase family protein [Candidatus Limnocylindria bacterium]|nr:glucoamylase family protein [Candidatus Limnocylindria bacterium]